MPIGVHAFTCYSCGKSEMCGDYIPLYCASCKRKIRACHGGKLPGPFLFSFDNEPVTPHEECPCSVCVMHRNKESIKTKLAALGLKDVDVDQ